MITIAFADLNIDELNIDRCWRGRSACRQFVCGLNLFQDLDDLRLTAFKKAIDLARRNGTFVKLAFRGGELPGYSSGWLWPYGTTPDQVNDHVSNLVVEAVGLLGLDGVDLVVEAKECKLLYFVL